MYYETRDYPTHGKGEGVERGTRARANAGLTLGIIGTVLGGAALLKRGGIGGVFGGGGSDSPANVNINSFGGGGFAPTAFEAYKHECEDQNQKDRKKSFHSAHLLTAATSGS